MFLSTHFLPDPLAVRRIVRPAQPGERIADESVCLEPPAPGAAAAQLDLGFSAPPATLSRSEKKRRNRQDSGPDEENQPKECP